MNMLPRIKQILRVEPYKIVCEWTNGEVRLIDLELKLTEHAMKNNPDNAFQKLLDKQLFLNVQLDKDAGTICWLNLTTMTDYDGISKPAQLDFCPDVLYSLSRIYI